MKLLPYVPDFVGFQTIVILDPYDMTFNAVGVLTFYLNPAQHTESKYSCIHLITY